MHRPALLLFAAASLVTSCSNEPQPGDPAPTNPDPCPQTRPVQNDFCGAFAEECRYHVEACSDGSERLDRCICHLAVWDCERDEPCATPGKDGGVDRATSACPPDADDCGASGCIRALTMAWDADHCGGCNNKCPGVGSEGRGLCLDSKCLFYTSCPAAPPDIPHEHPDAYLGAPCSIPATTTCSYATDGKICSCVKGRFVCTSQ